MMKISAWNFRGHLPPILPNEEVTSRKRSPYSISILHFVEHYAMTPQRVELLSLFLKYRQEWYRVGITNGVQWVNGSFVHNAELIKRRPPRDIDVVTLFRIPEGETDETLRHKFPDLFNRDNIKQKYMVDSYHQPFNSIEDCDTRKSLTYWYSMWSLNEFEEWKGFLEINLDVSLDIEAEKLLKQLRGEY